MAEKQTEKGISVRVIHIWLIIVTILMAGTVIYCTYRLTYTFLHLTAASEEHLELEKAAHDLMDASDYLTERVQRFTLDGDVRFLNEYFEEAFDTSRREAALDRMNIDKKNVAALEQLQQAMDNSVKLMDREYYAMRLVIEAKGYTDYPAQLKDVRLSDEDALLSPDEKMQRATEMVLDDEYYRQKDLIRFNMQESIDEVDKLMQNMASTELSALKRETVIVRFVILILTLFILFTVWLASYLELSPMLKAVEMIKDDRPIPEVGVSEFRYLAQAYNRMHTKTRSSLEHLNYKASHDELTGAYNRAGYDALMTDLNLQDTYMLLIDVDNFKSINDNHGHDTGDKVLVKVVNTLNMIFRDNDCICRIGGDEFVVLMIKSADMPRRLIESKIELIKEKLEETKDGLPPISLSIGIVNGKEVTDKSTLFEKCDEAMYQSKRQGKNTYTFY